MNNKGGNKAFNLAKEIRQDPKAQKFLKDQLVNIIRGLQ
jgi:hypothetical protein